MRVLLTGATGFIGSHLLERLLAQGDVVRVLVRPESLAKSGTAQRLLVDDGVKIIAGTLTDAKILAEASSEVDIVYHLAWQSNRPSMPARRRNTRRELIRANVEGTGQLLRSSAASKVRRFIYTSTVAVYGQTSFMYRWPLREQDLRSQSYYTYGPFWTEYIEPKITIENMIRDCSQKYGLEYVILRPSIVYGAGAPFAKDWVRRTLRVPWSSGSYEKAQLVHVRDLVDALLLAKSQSEAANSEFNIAGDEVATERQMRAMIRQDAVRIVGGKPAAGRLAGQMFDFHGAGVQRYDLTRAKEFLKYSPRVTLREGLGGMVSAVLAEGSWTSGKDSTSRAWRDTQRSLGGRHGTESPPGPRRADHVNDRCSKSELLDLIDAYYDWHLSVDALGDYYKHSAFWNFGYWVKDTKSQKQACDNLMEQLLGFIPKKQGTILDVACGKGATTRYLLKYYRPQNVAGINISEQQLEICRKNAPGCNFLIMDAAKLEFPDDSFDNIICVEAACHFNTREDFLREAHRVLKPGGRLVLSDAILPIGSRT